MQLNLAQSPTVRLHHLWTAHEDITLTQVLIPAWGASPMGLQFCDVLSHLKHRPTLGLAPESIELCSAWEHCAIYTVHHACSERRYGGYQDSRFGRGPSSLSLLFGLEQMNPTFLADAPPFMYHW